MSRPSVVPSRWRGRPAFSPAGFVLRAGVLILAWALAHAAGWRECTCVLSGTFPDGGASAWASFRGSAYVVLYLSAVLVAPVLLLAAGLWAGALRLAR